MWYGRYASVPGAAALTVLSAKQSTAGQETIGRFFGRSPLGPCLPCGAEQTPLSQWLRPLGRSLWLSSALSEPSAVSLPDLGAPTYAACLYGPTGKQKLRGERSGKRPIDSLPAVHTRSPLPGATHKHCRYVQSCVQILNLNSVKASHLKKCATWGARASGNTGRGDKYG